jgi:hypothetical protein
MKNRSPHGGTLAVVASTTIIIAILGVAVFFLVKIFGGERELQHATDSGNLNVAKQVIVNPGIELGNDQFDKVFRAYVELNPVNNRQEINLRNYNRLVGQTLLVALNAAADGTPEAIQHANQLIAALQGNANSISGRLYTKLNDSSNLDLVGNYFHGTARNNSLKMLGNGSSIQGLSSAFAVAYCEQNTGDVGATNLTLANIGNSLPYTDETAGTKIPLPNNVKTKYDGGNIEYVRGYRPLQIGNVSPLFGVPVQPTRQPHLVSLATFQANEAMPGAGAAVLPPNTFRNGAEASEEKSGSKARTLAAAIVGVVDTGSSIFQPSIRHGYVILDNSGVMNYNGQLPGLDNVAANELLTGIDIVPGQKVFSAKAPGNISPVERWMTTPLADRGSLSTNGMFDAQGNPVSQAEADAIPYNPMGPATCYDNNSGSGDCYDLLNSGSFDKAYHPNGGYQGGNANGSLLMATEYSKCKVGEGFSNGGGDCFNYNADQAQFSGLRKYMQGSNPIAGQSAMYDPNNQYGGINKGVSCKVTEDGTIIELAEQTAPGHGIEFKRFLTTCVYQIKPDATQQDLDNVFNKKLALGTRYFVHLDTNPASDTHNQVVVDANNPPGFTGVAPDGKKIQYSTTYNLTGKMVNPGHDFSIHDHLFMHEYNDTLKGTDTVSYHKASGYLNLLGEVKFTNAASGAVTLCDRN